MKLTKIKQSSIALLILLHISFFVSGQQPAASPRLIIPFGHQLGILITLFSHDNKLIITADEKMTIISDVRSGKPLHYLNGTNPSISTGDRYISTISDTLVMIWDATSGELVNRIGVVTPVLGAQFNPSKDLLLIKRFEGGYMDDASERYNNISIWNFTTREMLHQFTSKEQKNQEPPGKCNECAIGVCPIYDAWFNEAGDSIRLIYKNLIKTYSLGNYNTPQKVCLLRPGKDYTSGQVKILNNRTIVNFDDESAYCFSEYGKFVGSWDWGKEGSFSTATQFECISPSYNFQATYTNRKIVLRDLSAKTQRTYEVTGGDIKKLIFNQAGTHVLVEYLDEAPRIFSTGSFLESPSLDEKDFKGLPTYVYETQTIADAADATAVFDSMEAKVPPTSKSKSLLGKIIPIPDQGVIIKDMSSTMKNDVRSAYTNSGVIINLANNREISNIRSLIKLSGDVQLSPDKKIMLLNTGKILSIYSIPYAKILINLTGSISSNLFSPDSRWLVQYNLGGKTNIVNLATGDVKTVILKTGPSQQSFISFSPDSRQVFICSGNGGSAIIELASGRLVTIANNLNYFSSETNEIYGVINITERSARVYRKKDSSQLFALDLTEKTTRRNQQQNYNYKISFASQSNAIAIWNSNRIIYVKDMENPADTSVFDGGPGSAFSGVSLSPNGVYMNIRGAGMPAFVLNTRNQDRSFPAIIGMDDDEEQSETTETLSFQSMGKMMRSMLSGNSGGLMAAKETAGFSDTGDSLLVCQRNSVVLYQCSDGTRLKSFQTTGDIKYFSLKNDILICYYFGELKFYKISDGNEWFSMIPFTNDETVFLLPNGIYFGNKSATRHLGYLQDAKSLSYKQFDYNNNRPDIVLRTLGNTDQKYLAIYDSTLSIRRRREGLKDIKALDFTKAPEVLILNDREIKGEVTEKDLTLNLRIKGNGSYPDRLAVFINGNPIAGPRGLPLSHKSYSLDTTIRLVLTEGTNSIEVSVFDAAGLESYRQPVHIQYSPDSSVNRNIYFAGIGAGKYNTPGKKLNWATKDITDVLDSLRQRYGKNVIVDTLFNNRVTVENVRKLKSRFINSKPDDIVIVYYSGHGEIDLSKAEAFFGTYDMDFNNPSKRGISIKDFNDLMENIPARNKAIFLDACHSGEINKEGWAQGSSSRASVPAPVRPAAASDAALDNLVKGNAIAVRNPGETDPFDIVLELFTDLYQGNGSNIIVAARGLEAAKECDSIEHGVFTFAVLNGMTQLTADADSNAVLTIGELQNYVTRNVAIFSRICEPSKIQRAATRKENEYNDWAVLTGRSAAFRKKCVIKEIHERQAISTQVSTINKDVRDQQSKITDKETSLPEKAENMKEAAKKLGQDFKKLFGKKKNDDSSLKDYARNQHPAAILLFEDSGFTAYYEKVDDDIIFTISCAGHIPSLRVDVNGNGEADRCIDRIYKKEDGTDNICTQYVLEAEKGTDCGAEKKQCKSSPSSAILLVNGNQYYYSVPIKELNNNNSALKKSKVHFSFYNRSTNQVTYYPALVDGKMFGTTMEVSIE